jgi:hypothetical protein
MAPALPDVRSVSGYRIIGYPYASVGGGGGRVVAATVTLRTNRPLALADTRDGIAAAICLDGHCGVSHPLRTGNSTHHCYTQATIDGFPRRVTGDRTVLTVTIPGVHRPLRMTLRFEAFTSGRLRALCGARTIFDPIP